MKKTKVKILVAILIVLVIVLSILQFYSINIIKKTDIYLATNKVILSITAKNQLDEIYIPSLQTEVPVCLAGEITNEGIRVDNVIKTIIVESNSTYASYVKCPSYIGTLKSIGTMHNHINGNCKLSSTDLDTYASDLQNGQEIIGLHCNNNYVFYILTYLNSEVEEW